MPENRDSIQSEGGSEDEGSDWLASDEEGDSKALNIGRKETDKIQKKLYDEGYREGITSGKESMVQEGFDNGYRNQGVPVGRSLGQVLGQLYAMEIYLKQKQSGAQSSCLSTLSEDVSQLQKYAKILQMDDLIEPDWEAMEHERQHVEDSSGISPAISGKETPEAKAKRESILSRLHEKIHALSQSALYLR